MALTTGTPYLTSKVAISDVFLESSVQSIYHRRDIYIDGLMQNSRNSINNALELRLFCIKLSIYPALQPITIKQRQITMLGTDGLCDAPFPDCLKSCKTPTVVDKRHGQW